MATQRKRASAPTKSRSTQKSRRGSSIGGGFVTIARKIGGNGRWWTKLLRWCAFLAVSGILLMALLFFVLYKTIEIPNANADFQTQTTQVYYADGKRKLGEFVTQDRENIPLEQIPASMQAAAIAAEDRSFYTNRGIDIKGIVRALRDNTAAGSIQGGGSTITQQYVKILYLTQERSYQRKIKEGILSIKIHNQLTKEQILEGYLNTIYFGNGAYGVEVASQTYFNKPASKLNYAQSAMLATIINSPGYYDPYAEGAKERIQPRFNYVLAGMVKSGAITSEEAEAFADRIPKVAKKKDVNRFSGSKGYLLQLVKEKMVDDLKFASTEVEGGGLRITTTFDYDAQQKAIEAIKAHRPEGAPELHQALVSVQPGTGAVRAMYAGRDYLKNQVNWATSGTQPGSTFKPFAVIAALENGFSLQTKLDGDSPIYVNGKIATYNQGDSGGQSFGAVPLSRATAKSINTAFVDLTNQMEDGPNKVMRAAQAAGVPKSIIDAEIKRGAPLVSSLGYFPVAPVDMANAYATIAAGGERAEWYVIEKVEDSAGTTKYKHKVKTKRAFAEDVAADTIASMLGVVEGDGTGGNARTVCRVAGKTGTATAGDDDNQRVSSSWFAGFSPKLATAVMYNRGEYGNAELKGYMLPSFFGGQIPAYTFRTFMSGVLDPTDCGTFPPPANIKGKKGEVYKEPKPKKTKEPKPERTREPRPTPTRTTQAPAPTPTPTPDPGPTCGDDISLPSCDPLDDGGAGGGDGDGDGDGGDPGPLE